MQRWTLSLPDRRPARRLRLCASARRREMAAVFMLDSSISHENAVLAEAAAFEAVAPAKCAARAHAFALMRLSLTLLQL